MNKYEQLNIPDFLNPEIVKSSKKISKIRKKFDELSEEYEKKFDDFVPTESYGYSEKEWCVILKECIRQGKTVDELFGEEDEDYYE